MNNILFYIQIFLSISLVILILIQTRGTGFGRSSSGGSFTRRGLEKVVFRLTFVIAFLFIAVSILSISL